MTSIAPSHEDGLRGERFPLAGFTQPPIECRMPASHPLCLMSEIERCKRTG